MKIDVKSNSTNRNIATMIDLLNHEKQLAVIRNNNLFIINKTEVEQGDISIKSINAINWI